jgi:predicted porin
VGGGSGNATGLTFQQFAGTYTSGAVMVGLDATFFAQAPTGTTAAGLPVLDGLVRTRLVGTYNFGIAKVGLGYQTLTNNIASTMTASLTVPMGPVVFGLEYAARDAQGVISSDTTAVGAGVRAIGTAVFGATDGDKASSSVGVGATYNFSKSTSLNTSYIVTTTLVLTPSRW